MPHVHIAPVLNKFCSIRIELSKRYWKFPNWYLGHCMCKSMCLCYVVNLQNKSTPELYCQVTACVGLCFHSVLIMSLLMFWGCRPHVPERFKQPARPDNDFMPSHCISCKEYVWLHPFHPVARHTQQWNQPECPCQHSARFLELFEMKSPGPVVWHECLYPTCTAITITHKPKLRRQGSPKPLCFRRKADRGDEEAPAEEVGRQGWQLLYKEYVLLY